MKKKQISGFRHNAKTLQKNTGSRTTTKKKELRNKEK